MHDGLMNPTESAIIEPGKANYDPENVIRSNHPVG